MRHLSFKTLILSVFLAGIVFHANAQSTSVCLIVTSIDGTEQTFQLTEESQLYFENGDKLVIEDGNRTVVTLELSQIQKLVCSDVTGANESTASQLQILPNPTHDSFIIHNLTEAGLARIYSLNGRLMKAFQATEGSVVDMSDMSEGMYLLNINGQTLKLMKL